MKDFITIKLNTADDVKKFVNIVSNYDAPIEIWEIDGHKVINANSVLYLFTLDFNRNLCARIHTKNTDLIEEFYNKLERFEVR